MSTSTQTLHVKRKSEPEESAILKREKINTSECSESIDLFPLFLTILNAVNPEDNAEALSSKDATALLSQNHDVLLTIQQASYRKIQEQFKSFLEMMSNAPKTNTAIFQVLGGLYQTSLLNSSTKLELENTAANLPKLKEKIKPTLKSEMERAIKQAKELLDQCQTCKTRHQIQKLLVQITAHLQQLNEYRTLKQYCDVQENQRIFDLASILKRQRSPQQYPLIMSDYPPLVKQISLLSSEITTISALINELNRAKLKLQETHASCSLKEKGNPLEARFLNAFGNAFYNAFADHFWHLLKNFQEDSNISKILLNIPEWKTSDSVNTSIVCAVWEQYLPDVDFSEWMLMTLESMSSTQLDTLKKELQELEKKLNAVRENHTLEKTVKIQLQTSLQLEMRQLCYTATKPTFTTLGELKAFLTL